MILDQFKLAGRIVKKTKIHDFIDDKFKLLDIYSC